MPAPSISATETTPSRAVVVSDECYASECGRVTLYRGDCREILGELRADAVITDPPYGIKQDKGMRDGGYDSTGRYKRKPRSYAGGWDDDAPDAELLKMVIGSAPVTVMWGGNYLPLGRGGKWLVWNKEQVMPSYSDAELAWTNATGISVKLYTLHCNKARIEMGLHPTQKPVQLMAWSMDQAKVAEGALVLDPFTGSGSTAIACLRTGRRFVGIEKDPTHYATALKRITDELAQGDLFHGHNVEVWQKQGAPDAATPKTSPP